MTLYVKLKRYVPIPVKRFVGRFIMSFAPKLSKGTVLIKDGRRFKVIKDRLFLGVVLTKEYEPDLSKIASKLIKEGDVVVDIGANFGWYTTLFAKCVGRSGAVHSFEPFPRTFQILRENVELNGLDASVHLNNVCVGEEAGEVVMACDGASESGLAHVATSETMNTVTVSAVRLDDALDGLLGKIAYLKMDIEGFELFALKGMPELLQSENPPLIQIELNDEALDRASSNRKDIVSLLAGYQYRFFSIDSADTELLAASDALSDSDVFCMPPGQYAERMLHILLQSDSEAQSFRGAPAQN